MVRRCVGIEIGPSYLRAVQVSHTGEHFNIEKTFSAQTRRSTDSLSNILRSLSDRFGFDRHADVAVSMPNDAVFFKNLQTDSATLERLQSRDFSALEYHFPIPPDEIAAQVCSTRQLPGEKWSVLAAAVARTSLRERLQILSEAKVHPRLVDAPIFAVHAAIAVNHPEITVGQTVIAYVSEHYLTLAVIQDNNILLVRNIPIVTFSNSSGSIEEQIAELLSREAQMTWQRAFGTAIGQQTRIYLVTAITCEYLQSLIEENLHCQIVVVDPYAKVMNDAGRKADFPICVAEGLALRVLASELAGGVNFIEAGAANARPKLNLRKEVITCAALVGAIAAVWLVGIFVRLSYLESNYARVKNQIKDTFKAALPEEKNIVNPLVQLEQKLASFRNDYRLFASFDTAALRPFEVLQSISTSAPLQANMRVNDLLISGDSVRISGTCDSFESIYQWQHILQQVPGFKLVDVQDVQKEPKGGSVSFTMLLSLAKVPAVREQK
jgi:hypothetical protein